MAYLKISGFSGKSFTEVFRRFLYCFSGSVRSIGRTKFWGHIFKHKLNACLKAIEKATEGGPRIIMVKKPKQKSGDHVTHPLGIRDFHLSCLRLSIGSFPRICQVAINWPVSCSFFAFFIRSPGQSDQEVIHFRLHHCSSAVQVWEIHALVMS